METKQELNKDEVFRRYQQMLEFAEERQALREKNSKVDRSANDFSKKSAKMDAINRFKNKLKESEKKFDQIFNDLEKLNLSKYVAEIAKSLAESPVAQKELLNYMRLATRLHNDYEDFAPEIVTNLLKQIESGGDLTEESSKANRRKNLLRFGFELFMIGLPIPVDKLLIFLRKRILEDDENILQHSMNIGINFIQHYSEEFMGITPRSEIKEREAFPELPQIPKLKELITPEKMKKVVDMFKDFNQRLINQYKNLHKKMIEQEEIKKQILMTSGKIDEENENKYTAIRKNFQNTAERILIVADYLNIDPPDLNMDETVRFTSDVDSKAPSKEEDTKKNEPFEYQEERDIYVNLPDLKTVVPDHLLFSKKAMEKEKQVGDKSATKKVNENNEDEEDREKSDDKEKTEDKEKIEEKDKAETKEKADSAEEVQGEPQEVKENKEVKEGKEIKEVKEVKPEVSEKPQQEEAAVDKDQKAVEETPAQANGASQSDGTPKTYEDICARLDVCDSLTTADEFSRDFCYINNSSNRRKLINDILSYRKDYPLLIPFQMRVLATLNTYFKDISEKFIESLLREYNNLKNKSEKDKRMRNILYFCEGSKFRMFPTIYILNCVQECLNSFSGINIELVIYILEKAGAFLIRNKNKDDKMRFEIQLTQINNYKANANLQNSLYLQLENAYFLCKPPERGALKIKKQLSEIENYIRYLFFEKLDDEKVLVENVLRLPIPEVEDYLIKIFMKIATKGRYGQMNKICAILRYIGQFHPQFQIRTTDEVIEQIITGLEINYSGDRQKRITMIKFFAELFNYQVIEKDLVFKMLYFIMDFGHDPSNQKVRDLLDSKDDTFRISLICTLLEETSEFFKKRKYKNTIDKFLIFFQKYILSKNYIPINVEFQILDLFDTLSPNLKRFHTYKEAQEACNRIAKVQDFEENGEELNEMQTTHDDKKLKTEEDLEKERLIAANKEDKDFEDEYQELLKQSINDATKSSQLSNVKPLPISRLKDRQQDQGEDIKENPEKKKIVLCFRQGNKVITKNIGIDKNSELAQTISKKEEENKLNEELAKDSAKALHKDIVGRTDYVYGPDGFIGNEQIRYSGNKK